MRYYTIDSHILRFCTHNHNARGWYTGKLPRIIWQKNSNNKTRFDFDEKNAHGEYETYSSIESNSVALRLIWIMSVNQVRSGFTIINSKVQNLIIIFFPMICIKFLLFNSFLLLSILSVFVFLLKLPIILHTVWGDRWQWRTTKNRTKKDETVIAERTVCTVRHIMQFWCFR